LTINKKQDIINIEVKRLQFNTVGLLLIRSGETLINEKRTKISLLIN